MAADPGIYSVSVTYLSASGNVTFGGEDNTPADTWGLSPEIRVRTNKITTDASGWGRMQVHVTAPTNSAMRIDDLYVDPRMR
ncbi:MAG: hypothetical protein R2878_07230 [Thermoleophilia bacterium]